MKTGRITAPRTLEWIDVPEPVCGPGEVKIKLEYGCLCGTDSPFFSYDFERLKQSGQMLCKRRVDYQQPEVYPLPIGFPLHECVGTVVESEADAFEIGAFVLVVPPDMRGLAEVLVVPEDCVFGLPRGGVSKEELLLCQPLGTIHYAFRKLPSIQNKVVAVVGQGPIGQLMNLELQRQGAAKTIGIDVLDTRLTHSIRMGSTAVINAKKIDTYEALLELNNGRLADIVIEAVGHAEQAMDLCIELAMQDGQMLVFGALDTDSLPSFPAGVALRKNLSVHFSIGASKAEHFLPAARMISEGNIDVSPLITHRFPAAEAQTAFQCFADRQEGCLKVLLAF